MVALNLNRLAMLYELSRVGTVGEVADIMGYSHSAVSQQLSQLEKETGHLLVERHGRGVKLTDQGVLLAEHAARILTAVREAESALAATSQVAGVLRIACFQTVMVVHMPAVIRILQELYPQLQVEIRQLDVLDGIKALGDHQVDITIGEQLPDSVPLGGPEFDRQDHLVEPLVLVVPTGSDWGQVTDIGDLAGRPLILDPEQTAAGVWGRALCRTHGFEPYVLLDSNDPLLHVHTVAEGLGASFLPNMITTQWADNIRVQPLAGAPTRVIFSMVRSGRENHPAIVAFRRQFQKAMAGNV